MTNEAINKLNIYADAFKQIRDVLNECDRRHFLAETAIQFGYGAISLLSHRTGVAISTICRGIAELSSKEPSYDGHIRCAGAGRKPVEQVGTPSPGRGIQFEFIHSETKEALKDGAPVISVDTKKKENIGNFKNDGTEYRASGEPRPVSGHDFFLPEFGKASPYGVYVLNDNTAFVNLGTGADTGAFSVESICRWWYAVGQENFWPANRIVVTCDCGGGNGSRNRLWKLSLAVLAEEIDKEIEVIHYPPGTSKYNKVEHRLFCYITKHWQGKPLVDVQTVVNLIQSTTTETGLSVAG